MVTIVKQLRFSFWRFQEIFQFPLPPGTSKPLERMAAFYQTGSLENLVLESNRIRFSRGGILFALWFANHPRAKQNVSIEIVDGMVKCEFQCGVGIGHLRLRKSRLYLETQQLEAFLGGPVVESFSKPRIALGNPVFRLLCWFYRLISGTPYRAGRRLTRACVAGVTVV